MSRAHRPVQPNHDLNRVLIGDRAIAVHGEDEGELQLSHVNEEEGWIEFVGENGCIAISLELVRTEPVGGEVDD